MGDGGGGGNMWAHAVKTLHTNWVECVDARWESDCAWEGRKRGRGRWTRREGGRGEGRKEGGDGHGSGECWRGILDTNRQSHRRSHEAILMQGCRDTRVDNPRQTVVQEVVEAGGEG